MKSLSFKRNAKGFSLIELLIVLGIIAILLVAAFIVYPQVRDRNQANAEVTALTSVKANINNLYASKGGNYTGLTQTVAFNAKAFPASMVATSTAANPAFGGTATVTAGAAPGRTFDITYSAVPSGVCLGMVSGAAANFEQITVGSTAVILDAAGTAPQAASAGGTFNPGAAATACNATTPPAVVFTSN